MELNWKLVAAVGVVATIVIYSLANNSKEIGSLLTKSTKLAEVFGGMWLLWTLIGLLLPFLKAGLDRLFNRGKDSTKQLKQASDVLDDENTDDVEKTKELEAIKEKSAEQLDDESKQDTRDTDDGGDDMFNPEPVEPEPISFDEA